MVLALEPLDRRIACRAVDLSVRDLAHPASQLRLEGRPALEAAAGHGIALDVSDTAFVLALCARPIRRTGPRLEAPVAGEGVKARVEAHFPDARGVALDLRPGNVDLDLRRAPRRTAGTPPPCLRTSLPGVRTDFRRVTTTESMPAIAANTKSR